MSTSDDNDKVRHFPPLNNSNYTEWSMRMEAELIRKGLWDTVFCEIVDVGKTPEEVVREVEKAKAKRTAKKMAEARAELILRADCTQLVHMRDRDPMVIWESLARIHRARGLATRLALRRKFMSAVKGERETMQAFIGRVQAIAFELENIDVDVSDEDRILALTMGLDKSYESFVISLDGTPADKLDVEYMISRMLNEEARRGNIVMGGDSLDEGSSALLAGRIERKGGPGRSCWRCGKQGHIRLFCKEKPEAKSEVADVVVQYAL